MNSIPQAENNARRVDMPLKLINQSIFLVTLQQCTHHREAHHKNYQDGGK